MSAVKISPQLILFFVSVLSGFVMGGFYDIIRIFRRIVHHSAIIMFIEDIVYWLFAVAAVFFVMLLMTKGEIRFFAIVGFFIGMAVYFCTLSRIVIKLTEAVIKFIKALLHKIIMFLCVPIKILYKILRTVTHPFTAILTKFISFPKNYLKKNNICARIIMSVVSIINGGNNINGRNQTDERK